MEDAEGENENRFRGYSDRREVRRARTDRRGDSDLFRRLPGRQRTSSARLSKAGVSPRVAQAAMRHSSIDLTMNVYTDPRLLDVQGAVESLPHISTTADPNENRQRIAVGAENLSPSSVAVPVAVPADF